MFQHWSHFCIQERNLVWWMNNSHITNRWVSHISNPTSYWRLCSYSYAQTFAHRAQKKGLLRFQIPSLEWQWKDAFSISLIPVTKTRKSKQLINGMAQQRLQFIQNKWSINSSLIYNPDGHPFILQRPGNKTALIRIMHWLFTIWKWHVKD